jgi:hypothetical protein
MSAVVIEYAMVNGEAVTSVAFPDDVGAGWKNEKCQRGALRDKAYYARAVLPVGVETGAGEIGTAQARQE